MDPRQEAARGLEQAIVKKDNQLALYWISQLTNSKIQVKIRPLKFTCSSHIFWFPNEPSSIFDRPNNYFLPHYCPNSHKICANCLETFTIEQFSKSGLKNCYECPACVGFNIPNSILYDPELEPQYIAYYVGEDAVNADINSRALHKYCNNHCNNISSQAYVVCIDNHIYCEICIQKSIEESKTPNLSLKCPNKNCKKTIVNTVVEQACFSNKILLKKIWENLNIEGFLFKLCGNCDAMIKAPTASSEIECPECNKKFCIDCLEESHLGISCLAASEDQVKILDLPAPTDVLNPKNKLEREYLNAKFVFEQNAPGKVMVSAKLIVNKALEMKYKAKKEEILQKLTDKEDDIYVWHGSSNATYDLIAKNGFAIGGVTPGIPVKTNTAFGYGVYTAVTPQLSFTYVVEDTILCCKAFKGNLGPNTQASTPADLNNPNQNAFMRLQEGILVLFNTDQIIPVYLIKYKNA